MKETAAASPIVVPSTARTIAHLPGLQMKYENNSCSFARPQRDLLVRKAMECVSRMLFFLLKPVVQDKSRNMFLGTHSACFAHRTVSVQFTLIKKRKSHFLSLPPTLSRAGKECSLEAWCCLPLDVTVALCNACKANISAGKNRCFLKQLEYWLISCYAVVVHSESTRKEQILFTPFASLIKAKNNLQRFGIVLCLDGIFSGHWKGDILEYSRV